MTQARDTLVATAFVLATVTSGCGPRWYQPPATAVTPCTGQRYVEVRNTLEKTVDVYAYGSVSGGPSFLGNVSAGATARIPVGADVGYVYADSTLASTVTPHVRHDESLGTARAPRRVRPNGAGPDERARAARFAHHY